MTVKSSNSFRQPLSAASLLAVCAYPELLKEYFDRTSNDPKEQAISSVQRVVNALGVSIATVKRVMADSNRGVDFIDPEEILRG